MSFTIYLRTAAISCLSCKRLKNPYDKADFRHRAMCCIADASSMVVDPDESDDGDYVFMEELSDLCLKCDRKNPRVHDRIKAYMDGPAKTREAARGGGNVIDFMKHLRKRRPS